MYTCRGRKTDREKKKRRRKKDVEADDSKEDSEEENEEMEEDLEKLNVNETDPEDRSNSQMEGACAAAGNDEVFTVKIGPDTTIVSSTEQHPNSDCSVEFAPHPRMNALLAVKNGTLYLYGGIYEVGSKQLTLSDMYSLDLHKLDEWNVIIKNDLEDKVNLAIST